MVIAISGAISVTTGYMYTVSRIIDVLKAFWRFLSASKLFLPLRRYMHPYKFLLMNPEVANFLVKGILWVFLDLLWLLSPKTKFHDMFWCLSRFFSQDLVGFFLKSTGSFGFAVYHGSNFDAFIPGYLFLCWDHHFSYATRCSNCSVDSHWERLRVHLTGAFWC